jgi:hypothetical protein
MQGLWYGDKRDRVKWGALVYLARTKAIPCIVQIAYFRHRPDLKLQTEQGEVPLPIQVWDHFSNLRHIEHLGKETGLKIIVLDQYFEPIKRRDYINMIVSHIDEINKDNKNPKIVFLDPDTGIEPKKGKAEHITTNDLQKIWASLLPGDILMIYQHAAFTDNWLNDRKEKMSVVCDNVCVKHILGKDIAPDMAMLWCCKGPTAKSKSKRDLSDAEPIKTSKKKQKKPRLCACPCEKMTKGGYFCPGHDAKLKSLFLKVSRGKKSEKELDKIRQRMYLIWSKDNSKPLSEIAREIMGE